MRAVALGLMVSMGSSAVEAQAPRHEADTFGFVTVAREATRLYQDQAVALRHGYRRIGPDFPSMGEHWLHRALVMRGDVDPARPPILEYINVNGKPVLAGVAYAKLVYAGPPETSIPAAPSDWHYHAGSVNEESFIASHASGPPAGDSIPGARIAVLHAWVWLDNPAGLFATDNWALPWIRLGLDPTEVEHGPDPGTLAAALAGGGEAYFSSLLRIREALSGGVALEVSQVLGRHAALLRGQLERPEGRTRGALAMGWRELEREISAICSRCVPLVPGHH